MRILSLCRSSVVAIYLSGTCSAQTLAPGAEGPLLGAPALFSLDAASPWGGAAERGAEGWFKDAGSSTKGPVPLAFAQLPDFSAHALLRGCKSAPIPSGPLPDIDAQSLGLDVLPIDASGHLVQPRGRWAGLAFSVRRGTKGTGGRLAYEAASGDNAADFYHYVYRGSDCLPPPLIGRTLKGNDANEVHLPKGSDVDGLDVYAGLYARGLAARLGLPEKPTLWFSFEGSTSNLALVPATWWGKTSPSGAVLFASTWDGMRWSCPKVAFAPADLGLCTEEDVDAFAYDRGRGIIVLSTTPRSATPGCPARDPLLFVRPGTDVPLALPVIYAGGLRLSVDIGLRLSTPVIDDIDAVCGLDPVCGNRQQGLPIEHAFGQPWPTPLALPFAPLEAQGWREGGVGAHRYALWAHGGRPGSVAMWFVALPSGWPSQLIPMEPPLPVPLTSPFAGAPVGPRVLQLPPGLGRYELLVQWITFDLQAPFALHVAAPLRLRGP